MGSFRLSGWLFTFALAGFLSSYGQAFEVIPVPETIIGTTGQSIKIPIQIKNTGDKPQVYTIRLSENDLKVGQKGYFCQSGTCLNEEIREISRRIEAFSSIQDLYYIIETGLVTGQNQLVFEAGIKGTGSDQDLPVTVMIDEKQPRNVVFKSPDLLVHEIYPNPSSSVAYVDYELYNDKKSAKILIHNILGTPLGEQELPANDTRTKILTEDLSPGIYFYTVYLDNEGLITRKMVVRR
ncbi:MAG: T9SS type A sorting domain-containing protein [Cyclobacteriaceae bacterium]